MNAKSNSRLLLFTALLAIAPAVHAEPPPIVRELSERLHAQRSDFGNMETLRASYQSADKEAGIRHSHVFQVRLNGPIQVVSESDTEDNEVIQKDYFLHQSKVYAYRMIHHVPVLDGKNKRVTERYFLFDGGNPIYSSGATARVPLSATAPDLSKGKEREMPLPPNLEGWGDKLTARAFDIARSFRSNVGHHVFGDWDQWLLKDAPPEGSGSPPKRDVDWLPPEGTLALPVQESESPDGLFSIGWGYEKGPVKWISLSQEWAHKDDGMAVSFSTKLADNLSEELQNDENFLMNHVTGKSVGPIDIYYPGERQRFNHDELIAFWSPTNACVVTLVTAKWNSEFAHIAWIKDGKCDGSQDILIPLSEAASEAVRKSKHPAAKRVREAGDEFMYALDRIVMEDDGSFEAEVSAQIPREDFRTGFFETLITGTFSPGEKDGPAKLKVTKATALPSRY